MSIFQFDLAREKNLLLLLMCIGGKTAFYRNNGY